MGQHSWEDGLVLCVCLCVHIFLKDLFGDKETEKYNQLPHDYHSFLQSIEKTSIIGSSSNSKFSSSDGETLTFLQRQPS